MKNLSTFTQFLNRKSIKHAVMIIGYGGGKTARIDQILNSIETQCLETGHYINLKENKLLKLLATIVGDMCYKIVNNEFKELLYLHNAIKNICKKNPTFDFPGWIESSHGWWKYEPLEGKAFTKSIYNKNYKFNLIGLQKDYKNWQNAFIANFIHFLDSTLASTIINKYRILSKYQAILPNHDCFDVPFEFQEELLSAGLMSYKEILNKKYLNNILKNFPELYNALDKYINLSNNKLLFTSEDLNNKSILFKP